MVMLLLLLPLLPLCTLDSFSQISGNKQGLEAQRCALLECTLLPVKTEAGMGSKKYLLLLETVNAYFQVNEVTESLTKYFFRSLLEMFCP